MTAHNSDETKNNALPPVPHQGPWKTESSSAACHISSKHVLQVY